MVTQIDKLYEEYLHLEDVVNADIEEIMACLSEGKVPDQDASDHLDKEMTALKDQYDKIYTAARENLSTAEMPGAGRTAEDYVIAVQNSTPVLIENRRQIARILLNRFIRIRSSVDAYTAALAPSQEKASEALASVDSLTELLDIEKLTTGPRFFFEAMRRENIDADLLEILGEYYPERVLLGLIGKKYNDPAEDSKDGGEHAEAREQEDKELAELGYDPSFLIKDDILLKYDAADQRDMVVIPPWVRVIGNSVFSHCKIRRIFIPNSVQEIQYCAFLDSYLHSIVIPDSVIKLGDDALAYCNYLKRAVIGSGITRINQQTFRYCQMMDHLELPPGLQGVGSDAFEKCYSLKHVWVNGIEYRLRDSSAPRPVKLVFDNLEFIRDRIRSDYEDGLMDEFEYIDYNIAGDGYSY